MLTTDHADSPRQRPQGGVMAKTRKSRPQAGGKCSPVAYPPGFFTALLAPHKPWPYAGWRPVLDFEDWRKAHSLKQNAMASREDAARTGAGWGQGTVSMPGTPHHQKRPGMMR